MKNIITIIAASILSCFSVLGQSKTYSYESDPNDPTQTRIYTLRNGLKVYLSVLKDEPRIQTNIAVKAGSKNDPADCTGLAHYLEHMLFKGNSKLGTINWEKEEKVLEQISDSYEKHKLATDIEQKRKIYKDIDSLSNYAASFVAANEYDKLTTSLGASGTNAYTSNERTVYVNEIPSNELQRWLLLEATRFKELTLRLFHTELETVYEEYNRGLDNDFRQAYTKMFELLYKQHPYGTQPTIGFGEHLKNPSMVKIHEFFDTYYVPNNMAIMLSGDLDFDKTIALIDQYFGSYKTKAVPEFSFTPEYPINKPESAVVYGPQQEAVMLGFRCKGAGTKDAIYLNLLDYVLNNGTAGLIDLNLIQKQKLLSAGNSVWINKDYSTFLFYGLPKQGQTLEEVKNLLLAEIENLKQGNFDDWMIEACVKNLQLRRERAIENRKSRTSYMINAFIFETEWKDVWNSYDKMKDISKEEFVAFVKENFKNNYAVVEKRTGESNAGEKVEKPQITPIDIKRNEQSFFAQKFSNIPVTPIQPVFVNYEQEINKRKLASGLEFNYIKNETNNTFSLSTIIEVGNYTYPELYIATSYLNYLGTSKYSPEEFKKELFKNAIDINFSTNKDRTTITISGLQSSLNKGLELLDHLIKDAKPDDKAYNEIVSDILKSREDAKLDKGTILSGGLKSYALYGENSPFTNVIPEEDLKNYSPDSLLALVRKVFGFSRRYFYYGPEEASSVAKKIEKNIPYTKKTEELPEKIAFEYLKPKGSKVYFSHFDMVQTEMLAVVNAGDFKEDLIALSNVHNKYFGSGLSSIVFQDIREAKALAYSASNRFAIPSEKGDPNIVTTYIGTQTDKLPEAIAAMNDLLEEMPKVEKQFEDAKKSALKRIATNRVTKASIFWNYENLKRAGFEPGYRKRVYKKLQNMTIDELAAFFNEYVKSENITYLFVGDRDKINFEELKKLGPVTELSLEDLFGY